MKKYNPYLQMTYKNNKLTMTPETLKMWLVTYSEVNEKQKENIINIINWFTRKKEK